MKNRTKNKGVSKTGDRQQSTPPQETSAGGGSQDTHSGGAYPGEKTTTRRQRHPRNRTGRKGAVQRQPEGTEQGQPWKEIPWATEVSQSCGVAGESYRPTVERRQEPITSRKEKKKKKNPEDSEADQKGETRGDHKSKRRRAQRAASPSTD